MFRPTNHGFFLHKSRVEKTEFLTLSKVYSPCIVQCVNARFRHLHA
uniref:Uncharacterized protein n=1 Tax=Anguilla anguilla TaxID=7936 RepID=A0A0E9VKG2_ANGAN